MNLFSPTVLGLGKALDLYAARHRILAENVAHAETPGYRAKEMDFGGELDRAFEKHSPHATDADGASAGESASVDGSLPPRIELRRDPVDLDREMALLSENSLRVTALSRIVARKYAGLKSLIGGLGR
jgi:flagellar basal-body rod protein FlgB